MKPSIILDLKRSAIREATDRFHAANPRIFGSVLHGTDKEGSDLDLLVDALPGSTLLDLGGLQVELEYLLGIRVDLLPPPSTIFRRSSAIRFLPRPVRYEREPPS